MVNRRHGEQNKIGRSIMFTPEVLEAIAEMAEADKRSVSFMVDELLQQYLKQLGKLPRKEGQK